jgi:myo-inositol-1-phosphate synthase
MLIEDFTVQSENVQYSEEYITSTYNYDSTQLTRDSKGSWVVSPTSTEYQFRVDRRVPKLGYAHTS